MKFRLHYQNNNWSSYLQKAYDSYNNEYHSTIKRTPREVFKFGLIPMNEIQYIPLKYDVGDKVRLLMPFEKFSKGDKPRYTNKIYTIIR